MRTSIHGVWQCEAEVLLKGLLSRFQACRGGARMTAELFSRIRAYREAMAIVCRMEAAGLINSTERTKVEAELAKKYGLSQRSILRDIT